MPAIVFTSVDLPAPLSPTRPTTSPAWTSRSTPSRACTAPNRLLTPRRESSAPFAFIWRPFLSHFLPRGGAGRLEGRPARRLLLHSGRLARRRVGVRADLSHGPEVVLHDRVLDVGLRDRNRSEDHGRDARTQAGGLLVYQARRRLLALDHGRRKL